MAKCKITVLKRMFNADLAEEYRRADIHFGPCPHFAEGDEFVVEHIGVRPEVFFATGRGTISTSCCWPCNWAGISARG